MVLMGFPIPACTNLSHCLVHVSRLEKYRAPPSQFEENPFTLCQQGPFMANELNSNSIPYQLPTATQSP